MIKYCFVVGLSLLSSSVMAAMYTYQPIGSSTVLGDYSNRHALSTAMGNPAAPYLMANLQGFRVGFLGPIGIGVEGGGVNGINDRVDRLEAIFDENFTSSIDVEAIKTEAQSAPDPDAFVVAKIDEILADINSSLDSADAVISDISQTTYVKFATTVQAPFLPIIYKTRRRGVFTLDASASLVGRASILADNLTLTGVDALEAVTSAADLDGVDISGADVESDTSLYLKRVSNYKFSIGYSEMYSRTEGSALILGGRVNFHKLAMDQKLEVLNDDGESSVSYGDFFLSRESVSDGVSLDLGAIIAARYLQLGATLSNVNEPEFDYKVISNCVGLTGGDLSACNVSHDFADEGKLSLNETYKMKTQLNLSAALKSKDQNFSIAASFDANSIKDPLGDKYQWGVVSVSYFSENFFSMGLRAGVRKNMVEDGMTYYTAGVTLSRRLDIDVAYAPENERGDSGAFFSIGYSFVY